MFLLYIESAKIQFLIRRAKHGPAISAQSWPRTPYPYKLKSSVLAFCNMMILTLRVHLWSWTKASTHSLGLQQVSMLQSVHFCPAAKVYDKRCSHPSRGIKHVVFLQTNGKLKYNQSKPAYTRTLVPKTHQECITLMAPARA